MSDDEDVQVSPPRPRLLLACPSGGIAARPPAEAAFKSGGYELIETRILRRRVEPPGRGAAEGARATALPRRRSSLTTARACA
eukprot:CAMPEP_0184102160 /NCGR_PEP_ID=MMETSP0974-20121125/13202_1 /TAXON_ID=483370 /ORGANISM="non described non described, Strain CCMP2097" /LENGTH=82 /DNA_ID=CAMNT_0026405105 /DNA_START=11 /DNA_END=256 /DNA_ORIENTATION=-